MHRLPDDLDIVVGIPRSGLMAAALVALAKQLPLADVQGFCEGRVLSAGRTRRVPSLDITVADCRHALVFDDSVASGGSMAEARVLLERAWPNKRFTYCAAYGEAGLDFSVTILEQVPQPRFFEWNIMNHPLLAEACVDIDGVLCHDPTDRQNDDGANYIEFLLSAPALHTPRKRIGALVTSRLEKYRSQTETWLARHGIQYDRLIMLDLPDMKTRQLLASHGSFKGNFYKESSARLFIESEFSQAVQIARISGKPVFSIEQMQLVRPDQLSITSLTNNARSQFRSITRQNLLRLLGRKRFEQLKRFVRGQELSRN
nr:phosphoribosyltransferase [Bradyrhizobium sp. NBAIM01]